MFLCPNHTLFVCHMTTFKHSAMIVATLLSNLFMTSGLAIPKLKPFPLHIVWVSSSAISQNCANRKILFSFLRSRQNSSVAFFLITTYFIRRWQFEDAALATVEEWHCTTTTATTVTRTTSTATTTTTECSKVAFKPLEKSSAQRHRLCRWAVANNVLIRQKEKSVFETSF